MIYDCFSFFNELDVLEIRLNTLNAVVDKFIIVEAPWTHTGKPKPLYFNENRQRFATFLDKIIHIVASEPPVSNTATERENAWIRENWQRNEIAKGLTEAKPDDMLIIADLDEIPDPNTIDFIIKNNTYKKNILNLNLRCYAFFLNNHCVSSPKWSGGPQVISYAKFINPESYLNHTFTEATPREANIIPSATLIRFAKIKKEINNAGWHLSSMGGVDAIKKKMCSIAEFDFEKAQKTNFITQRINAGKGVFGKCDRYMPEPLHLYLPPYIQKSRNLFNHLIIKSQTLAWYLKTPVRYYCYLKKMVLSI
jgi:beta-1,4-mannosyl-glycoprotein beta-1,4-N-acetylglucosaminyltransferase